MVRRGFYHDEIENAQVLSGWVSYGEPLRQERRMVPVVKHKAWAVEDYAPEPLPTPEQTKAAGCRCDGKGGWFEDGKWVLCPEHRAKAFGER